MDPARGPMHCNECNAMPNNQNFFGGYHSPDYGSPMSPFGQVPPHTPTHNIAPLMHAAPQSPVHFVYPLIPQSPKTQPSPMSFNTYHHGIPEPPFVAPISPIPHSGSPHFYATPPPYGYNSPVYNWAYAAANWNGACVPVGHQLAQPTDLDNEGGPMAPRNSNSAMHVTTNNSGQDAVRPSASPGCHMSVARARKSAVVFRSNSMSESLDPPSTPRNKLLVKTAVMESYTRSQTDIGRGSNDLSGRPGDVNSTNYLGIPFQPHPLYKTRPCNKYNELTGCPYAGRCLFRHPGDPPTPMSEHQRFFPSGSPGRAPQQSPFLSRTGRNQRPRGLRPRGPDSADRVMSLDTVAQALDLVEKRGTTAMKRYNSELSLGQHTYSQMKALARRGQGGRGSSSSACAAKHPSKQEGLPEPSTR